MDNPFPKFNHLADCRHGKLIYNAHDIYIGRSLKEYGEFSQGETELFQQVVKAGATALDIGANIGAHTLRLAQLVGPQGHVLAFEPQRIVFQTLCGNMAINSVTNTTCLHSAVGSEPGTATIPQLDYARDNNFGGLSLLNEYDGETVNVITIDGLKLERCDFIKIDVEGMEEAVLRGAQETIERFEPFIYLECHHQEYAASLQKYVDSLGYAMYWHRPRYFNPDNFAKNKQNVFGDIVSLNVACAKEGSRFQITGQQRIEVPVD